MEACRTAGPVQNVTEDMHLTYLDNSLTLLLFTCFNSQQVKWPVMLIVTSWITDVNTGLRLKKNNYVAQDGNQSIYIAACTWSNNYEHDFCPVICTFLLYLKG